MTGRRRLEGEPSPTYGTCPGPVSLFTMLYVASRFGGVVLALVGCKIMVQMLHFSA
jgi:hypothetical protein